MSDGIYALVVSSSLLFGRGLHPGQSNLIASLIRKTPSGRAVTCHDFLIAEHAIETGQYNVIIIPFEWGEDDNPHTRMLDGLVAYRYLGKVLASLERSSSSKELPLLVVYGWKRELLDDESMFGFAKIHNALLVGEPSYEALVEIILAERKARKARLGGEKDARS